MIHCFIPLKPIKVSSNPQLAAVPFGKVYVTQPLGYLPPAPVVLTPFLRISFRIDEPKLFNAPGLLYTFIKASVDSNPKYSGCFVTARPALLKFPPLNGEIAFLNAPTTSNPPSAATPTSSATTAGAFAAKVAELPGTKVKNHWKTGWCFFRAQKMLILVFEKTVLPASPRGLDPSPTT
jgi:hypothetical protein